jgi:hypothetical protein
MHDFTKRCLSIKVKKVYFRAVYPVVWNLWIRWDHSFFLGPYVYWLHHKYSVTTHRFIRYKNVYIQRLNIATLSCKLTSNFNTAVTIFSTHGPILSWNSRLTALTNWNIYIHLGQHRAWHKKIVGHPFSRSFQLGIALANGKCERSQGTEALPTVHHLLLETNDTGLFQELS